MKKVMHCHVQVSESPLSATRRLHAFLFWRGNRAQWYSTAFVVLCNAVQYYNIADRKTTGLRAESMYACRGRRFGSIFVLKLWREGSCRSSVPQQLALRSIFGMKGAEQEYLPLSPRWNIWSQSSADPFQTRGELLRRPRGRSTSLRSQRNDYSINLLAFKCKTGQDVVIICSKARKLCQLASSAQA